ncbi:hypothetical protein VTO73DRAFT_1258 [Trametes versicolor]
MPSGAYLTFITTEGYLPGLLVLHKTLQDVGSKYPLVVMATRSLPQDVHDVLTRKGIAISVVDSLTPKNSNIAEHDSRFAETWTKLRMFELIDYERVVALDADMVVKRNMDELMEIDLPEGYIAACHVCACNPRKLKHYPKEWIPENCAYSAVSHPGGLETPTQITDTSPGPYKQLNSGLVVLSPSLDTFNRLESFLEVSPLVPEFKFPDQDLLTEVFKGRWKPLPWCYNGLKTLRVIHSNLWRDEEVRCVHYILSDKPWRERPKEGDPYELLNQWWWDALEQVRAEMETADPEGWKLVEKNVAHA